MTPDNLARRASMYVQPPAHTKENPPKYWPAIIGLTALIVMAGLANQAAAAETHELHSQPHATVANMWTG